MLWSTCILFLLEGSYLSPKSWVHWLPCNLNFFGRSRKVVILQIIQWLSCNREISALSSLLCSKWKLEVFGFTLRKKQRATKNFWAGHWKDQICFIVLWKQKLFWLHDAGWIEEWESRGKLGGGCNHGAKDEQNLHKAWHGDQKLERDLRRVRFNRISWQTVDVGACIHIHALTCAELWWEKEESFRNCAHVST